MTNMEFRIVFGFTLLLVLMLIVGIYSVGSYESNQPDSQSVELETLDSLNKKLEMSNQMLRAEIEKNDKALQELESQNLKIRKALNMPPR